MGVAGGLDFSNNCCRLQQLLCALHAGKLEARVYGPLAHTSGTCLASILQRLLDIGTNRQYFLTRKLLPISGARAFLTFTFQP